MANAPEQFTTIYEDQFHTAATEVIMQETEIFNGASNNTIILADFAHIGMYSENTFFGEIAGIVRHRDHTSSAVVADKNLDNKESRKVKLDRGIGPVLNTLDKFRKIGKDPAEISFILGQQWGKAIVEDYVNTALPVAAACFAQDLAAGSGAAATAHNIDATGGTLNHGGLVQAMAAFGDAGKNVAAWVMHSKQYYDLMGQSIADGITNVASVTISNGTIQSLNRPVIVTDCADLIVGGNYQMLALQPGAITVEESQTREIVSQLVTGNENISMRFQGEYAFTLGMKGYAYDTASGANPAAGVIDTAAAWDQVQGDHRSLGGVVLTSQ